MKLRFRNFIFTIILIIPPISANAISITNLDDKIHQFNIQATGEEPTIIRVSPNQRWRSISHYLRITHLTTANSPSNIVARDNDDYIIWRDGSFGIQHRRNIGGRTNW